LLVRQVGNLGTGEPDAPAVGAGTHDHGSGPAVVIVGSGRLPGGIGTGMPGADGDLPDTHAAAIGSDDLAKVVEVEALLVGRLRAAGQADVAARPQGQMAVPNAVAHLVEGGRAGEVLLGDKGTRRIPASSPRSGSEPRRLPGRLCLYSLQSSFLQLWPHLHYDFSCGSHDGLLPGRGGPLDQLPRGVRPDCVPEHLWIAPQVRGVEPGDRLGVVALPRVVRVVDLSIGVQRPRRDRGLLVRHPDVASPYTVGAQPARCHPAGR